jgi:hypothetical protein
MIAVAELIIMLNHVSCSDATIARNGLKTIFSLGNKKEKRNRGGKDTTQSVVFCYNEPELHRQNTAAPIYV